MGIALAIFLLILAMAGHEFGHALIMREAGIRIREIGIGLPYGPRLELNSKPFDRFFRNKCSIVLSPLLLGAYVIPVEDDLKKAVPLRKELAYLGGGVLVNMMLFTVLLVISILANSESPGSIPDKNIFGVTLSATSMLVIAGIGAPVLLWLLRNWISVLFPFAGIYLLVLLAGTLSAMPASEVASSNGSIVLIGELVAGTTDWRGAIYFGIIINLALGATNLLPFYPLDGGRIVERAIERISSMGASAFRGLSKAPFILLVVWALGADLWRLAGYFFR